MSSEPILFIDGPMHLETLTVNEPDVTAPDAVEVGDETIQNNALIQRYCYRLEMIRAGHLERIPFYVPADWPTCPDGLTALVFDRMRHALGTKHPCAGRTFISIEITTQDTGQGCRIGTKLHLYRARNSGQLGDQPVKQIHHTNEISNAVILQAENFGSIARMTLTHNLAACFSKLAKTIVKQIARKENWT